MNRRDFLNSARAAAALGALTLVRAGTAAPLDSWHTAFHEALPGKPWLTGYRTMAREQLQAKATWHGKAPGLRGTLYRNGPAGHEVGGFRYRHWFDGDGMVQRFAVSEDGVAHLGRFVRTHKRVAESGAGRALYPTFGSRVPNANPVTKADVVNTANISTLIHNGELYALWEAGSPHRLDPATLETLSVHSYSPQTQGLPFSAHPRVEADGTLWNFGYVSAAKRLVLWHIDAAGTLVKAAALPIDPITMIHDFVVTRRHLVFLIPPLHFEPGASSATFLQAHRWHPEHPTRVLVVDKNDFSRTTWLELPAQWVFHFGNAWEDKDGFIRFDGARAPDPSIMFGRFRDIMRGQDNGAGAPARSFNYVLHPATGYATEEPLMAAHEAGEFPTIDPRVSGRQYRHVALLTTQPGQETEHGHFDTVMLLDVTSGHSVRYTYPAHEIAEEHLIVPGDGGRFWLVGTTLAYREEKTRLNVFDGKRLADGPVAIATLPYPLPLGLHGKWQGVG
ncbi:MAG: carotenoid oxygenase [Gammaproteobacteria bacterium]|nr:carotenoid oxygenase [Gammaproteobacteria bacterium]